MLLVNTYIQKSPIHGTGLFAAQDICAGQIIWAFHAHLDLCLDSSYYDLLTKPAQDFIQNFSYWSSRQKKYIVCLDNARFMNHSQSPNTKTAFYEDLNAISEEVKNQTAMLAANWALVNLKEGCTVALRDIKTNEELLCNYETDFPDLGPGHTQDFLL
jgi:SET domain-containing protein